MLVDVKINNIVDPGIAAIRDIFGARRPPIRLSQGVWDWAHWNPEFEIGSNRIADSYPEFDPSFVLHRMRMKKKGNEFFANFEPKVSPLTLWRLHKKPLRKNEYGHTSFVSAYGVVDTPEQLLGMYDFEADPRKLFIYVVQVFREGQPSDGGWRYHKWGEYLGDQKPEHEYLYDDKHIDSVYTYHILEMK